MHMGFSLFGERSLRFWEKSCDSPSEILQKPGCVYISNPGAFEHQVVHRDDSATPGLLQFGGMGCCKVAVQFRSSVFTHNRGTKPPAKPMAAFKAASAVVALWLAETTFEEPTVTECREVET